MGHKKLIQILVMVCICLFAPAIATGIADFRLVDFTSSRIGRITNIAWSIRFACLILSAYFIFEKKER